MQQKRAEAMLIEQRCTFEPENKPADKIERPKKERFTGNFYDSEEIGLKWDAIDFANDTIIIRHTVTTCNIDGKSVTIAADSTKTKSSKKRTHKKQGF